MRVFTSALLLLIAALAGCAGDDTTDDGNDQGAMDQGTTDDASFDAGGDAGTDDAATTGPGADSDDGSSDDHADDGGSAAVNTPPTISIVASAVHGEAPFDVTFDLDGFDDEGDLLTWDLDVDGDGSAEASGTENNLPGNYTHTFADAGNYTVTYTVDDGTDAVNASLEIVVVAAEVEEPGEAGIEYPVVLTGDVMLPCLECYDLGFDICISWATGQDGFDCIWFELDPAYAGQPFTTSSGGDVDVEFRDGCGYGSGLVQAYGAEGHDTGNVPAGATCVLMADFVGPDTLVMTIG